MNTITWNKKGYKGLNGLEKKVSLMEKFKNYVLENGTTIVCGLMMVNGNTNVYQVYKMLNA